MTHAWRRQGDPSAPACSLGWLQSRSLRSGCHDAYPAPEVGCAGAEQAGKQSVACFLGAERGCDSVVCFVLLRMVEEFFPTVVTFSGRLVLCCPLRLCGANARTGQCSHAVQPAQQVRPWLEAGCARSAATPSGRRFAGRPRSAASAASAAVACAAPEPEARA